MKKMDDHLLRSVEKNSEGWLGKKVITREHADVFTSELVKRREDKEGENSEKFPLYFRATLPFDK